MEIPGHQLGTGSPIKIEILETEEDLYNDFARVMANKVRENNAADRPTTFIVPVGPVGQYRRFARLCNIEGISCENLVCFNMDEYLDDNDEWLPLDHPLSFRAFMDRELYSRLDEDKRIPKENTIFPDPHCPETVLQRIDDLGGIDIAFGGIGINGHIAFNEPPEPGEDVPPEVFQNLPTRVLSLTRETRLINSVTCARGNRDIIPRRAVTIGMKEILGARQIHFYLNRRWQSAIIRKVVHGPITPQVPASFFQEHPDCVLTIASYVAELPAPQLQ